MKIKSLITGCFLMTMVVLGNAQETTKPAGRPPSPVPVEAFVNGSGIQYQLVFNKPLFPESKWSFFNLSNYFGDYENDPSGNQFVTQSLVAYDVWNGLGIAAGASMVSFSGFRPTAGIRYVYASPQWLFVLLPRFDLTETHNFETFGLLEKTFPIKDDWKIYSRAQGLYNYNVDLDFHGRSYLNFRVGPSYKNIQFGFGFNLDVYGPAKIQEENYGVFVRIQLI